MRRERKTNSLFDTDGTRKFGAEQLQAMLPNRLPPEIQTLYNRAHAALPAQEE